MWLAQGRKSLPTLHSMRYSTIRSDPAWQAPAVVPVLLRCGSVPTLPLRAHRNCCDRLTKLNTAHKAEVGNGPARRRRWGPGLGPTGDLPALRRGGI